MKKPEERVTAEVVTASRRMVDSLLAANTENRPLKQGVVERYVRDIKEGRWLLTNQGIGVSEDGVLLDGQHRLEAIKKAGYPPVKFVLVVGLSRDAQMVVDQGAKRTARDMLQFAFDYRVSRFAPAIASCIFNAERSWSLSPTITEIHDMIVDYLEEINLVVSAPKAQSFFAAAYLAAFVHCLKKGICTPEQAKEFIRTVEEGEMLTKSDPQFHLRNHIITSKKGTGGRGASWERFAKATRALTAYAQGQSMLTLRV